MTKETALKILRELHNKALFSERTALETFIPELAETEDERIRKFITHELACLRASEEKDSDRYKELTTAISWLEKQREKNPVISDDALREGIAHFGITQYQIDNWLKKYIDVEKQGEQKETNLVEILKHYPRETELYSPLYGKLWLAEVDEEHEIITCYRYPLEEDCTRAVIEQEDTVSFYSNGTTGLPDFSISKDCMLFLYNIEKQGEQQKTKIDLIMWKPVSEYNGGRVLATNDVDILVGYINSDGDCESEDNEGTLLCGITGFVKIEDVLPPKQGEQKEYTFKSIPRLLYMIEPSDRAKAYCQKLIDTLAKEGYNTDAKIVEEVLNGWNGECIPMAVMDEQKPAIFIPKFRVGDKLVSTKNPRLTYEVLEVGHINELGNPEYKVEIFTDGKVSNPRNIHDMECYKVDEWAKLVEQKPADKVEPKFHEGEWVVNNTTFNLCHILKVEHGQYICDDCSFPITKENEYHLWTIHDAEEGDVLVDNYAIIIFRKIGNYVLDDVVDFYICYSFEKGIIIQRHNLHCGFIDSVFFKPATKEQRDLLFSKMKEAGYEWDSEKKELKIIDWSKHIKYEPNGPSIIEEKSAWSEENSCYYDDICEILINLINSPKSKINKDAIQKDLDWIMSIEKSQLNPAWSEEDKDALDIAIRIIQNGGDDCAGILDSDKALKWLKSLKDRVLPQLNQELSDDMTVNEYADLGLPSGTLWKRHNEEKFNDGHDFYTYNEAVQKFGGQLPTKEQFKELKDLCKWTWTGNGYNVTGVNGDSIFLPAAGYSDATGNEYYVEKYGNYWSSIPSGELYAWSLDFNPSWVGMSGEPRGLCQSVRLINSTVH